jgi:hypothetical protein
VTSSASSYRVSFYGRNVRCSCGFSWKEEGQERKECGGQGRSSNRGRFLFLFYFLDDFFWPKNKSQEQ